MARWPAALAGALLLVALPALAGDSGKEPPAVEGRITGKEALAILISGRTHYRDRSDGSSEIEYHHPDGQSAYVWEACVERGRWWTTDSEICFFYPDSMLQGPHCFWVERKGETLEFWWSGDPLAAQPTATTTHDLEGNVEALPLGVSGECLTS